MPQRYVLPLLALSVLLLLLASGGCVNTSIGTKHIESTAALPTNDLLREAELAFASQRFPTSELYYSRLSARPDLPAEERALVYQRLTASAVHADHFNSAFTALNKWVETDPAAVDNADYFALSMEIYHRLNLEGAMAQLTDRLVNDSAMDWDVRASGGVALARMHFADGEDAQALKVLGGFYSMAPDRDGRAALERAFLRQLRDDPWDSDLVELTTPKNHTFFPYALIAFEDARRLAGEDKTWAASWKTMRQVVSEANLADKSHLGDILIALEREHGQPTLAVALALPLSGRYQAVGQKVASGVAAAQWMLANSGVEVEVKVINTDAPGWTARIASLPPHFAMVGGPLEVSNFREIEASGAMAGRAFFTFLPSLGDGQEGTQAWRFFPSRRDEVRVLADMAVNKLGVSRLAVLAPDEKFGQSMSDLFRQEAMSLGGTIVASQNYPPNDQPQWGQRVASLLGVPVSFDKEAPLPLPKFGAVFIPDGWSQAQLLVPNFFFYDASEVVFLGPDLWTRALNGRGINENYYDRAVSPGAWWGGSEGAQKLSSFLASEGLGEADFWVALGYDYLQLVTGLGAMPPGWTADDLNRSLAAAKDIPFAMAPIIWDAAGQASQKLYLFTPTETGYALSDVDGIALGIERAKSKREQRTKIWRATKQSTAAKKKAAQ